MLSDFGSYTRGGGLIVETARTIDFGSYTRGGGLVIQSVHHVFSPTCRPVHGQTGGAADCSFVSGGQPAVGGAGYSPYPWWKPFFIWMPPSQAQLPLDLLELPRRYEYVSTGPTIRCFGAALCKKKLVRRPIIRRTSIVQSQLVPPRVAAQLLFEIFEVNVIPPPRRILTAVSPVVSARAGQQMREDDELMLVL